MQFKKKDFIANNTTDVTKLSTTYKHDYEKHKLLHNLEETGRALGKLQDIMYAHAKYGVLVCIQGMDTAGKDSLIREVFRFFNPRGVVVHSFKAPSSKELKHDYLWRHYLALPEKGKFSIFNRSHYENVLVTRVNPNFLLSEKLPGINSVDDVTPSFWEARFAQIKNFEQHITDNGVILIKIFLHLGKDEQRDRILRRIDKRKHNWKFAPSDVEERQYWEVYQQCYSEAISQTHSEKTPWYVVPADDKLTARCIVSNIVLETLEAYSDIKNPELSEEAENQLQHYRKMLMEKEI
ncbi:MAG: PPK2 family polyphosphate kinase [Luteibaculaceae bacterium]